MYRSPWEDLLSVTEGKGEENRVQFYFTVFLLHMLLLLMTIAAGLGVQFQTISEFTLLFI